MNCHSFQNALPDLLLDPSAVSNAEAELHLAGCTQCQEEFRSYQSTFAMLDAWTAPEPTAYFDQKLAVRLREEAANPPAGWFERLQSRLLYNTGRQFRPALVGSLALALLIGGGSFAGITGLPGHHAQPQVSATVGDLQILDKNEQAFQQMDQLLQEEEPADDNAPPLS